MSVALAVGIPTVVGAVGVWLYVPYRDQLRPVIFQTAPEVGLMFERKEHLAFGVVLLAWAAALAYFGSWRTAGDAREQLHKFSHRAFTIAAVLAATVASLGTYVASYRSF